jgi:hypothetical protein
MKSNSMNAKILSRAGASINWRLWIGMKKIKVWHAIALTIPINPEKIKTRFHMNKTRLILTELNKTERDEFELRWKQFEGNTPLPFYNDFEEDVTIHEFYSWAKNPMQWGLPVEIEELIDTNKTLSVESEIEVEVTPKRKGRPRLLTPEKIKEIRAARKENPDITQDQLAYKFNISRSLVRDALANKGF